MIELNWKQTDPLSQEWDDMIDEILGADERLVLAMAGVDP